MASNTLKLYMVNELPLVRTSLVTPDELFFISTWLVIRTPGGTLLITGTVQNSLSSCSKKVRFLGGRRGPK